jgi:hypothetical protein
MDRQDVKDALDGLAREAVPERVDLWPGVAARVERAPAVTKGAHIGAWRPLLRGRLGWAGLALSGLLVLGATAYAASPVISKLLTMDDHFKTADAERLGRSLDLSQTLGDVSVTVQWAYADGQRVLVAYSIQSADGRRFDPGSATLTDSAGATLHSTGGYGVTGHSDILGVSLPPGQSTHIATFDSPAGVLTDKTASLKLHLSLSTAEYAPPSSATPVVVVNGNDTTAQGQAAVLLATAGPFEFDFEVPVVRAK